MVISISNLLWKDEFKLEASHVMAEHNLAMLMPCDTVRVNSLQDQNTCHGRNNSSISFSSPNSSPIFYKWIKRSTIDGQATNIPSSGFISIPSFVGTNTLCKTLVDTLIVTPYIKFTPIDSCEGVPDTFVIRSMPTPVIEQVRDSSFCNGNTWATAFNSTCSDSVIFRWQKKSGPGGTTIPSLPLSGVGNLPILSIVNTPPSCFILTDTIYVTAYYKSLQLNDSCPSNVMKFIIKSVPTPVISKTRDTAFCRNTNPIGFNFSSTCAVASVIRWTKTSLGGPANSGTNIPLQGMGNIPAFTTTNNTLVIKTDTIISYSTFISVGDSCVGPKDTFLIHVLPNPTINAVRDTSYCHGTKVPRLTFTSNVSGTTFIWNRTGANFGIPTSGVDSIPMYMVMNTGNTLISNTIVITPQYKLGNTTCNGSTLSLTISAMPQPKAICRPVTVYLNGSGTASVSIADVNDGSIGRLVSVSPSTFNCTNVGLNMVTLTVIDSCANTSACVADITVLDTIRPVMTCNNQKINLQPSSCETRINYLPTATDNCNSVTVTPQDTNYNPGKIIQAGLHNVCYVATDNSGRTATCCITINVVSNTNPIGSLACADDIQVSLDDNCSATISADLFLVGGPYRCFSDYKILLQLWNGGAYIDRNLTKRGVQVNASDIGKILKVTIVDTVSGNSCWSKMTVEDKLAPRFVKCAADIFIKCDQSSNPSFTGTPIVLENCGEYSLTYSDVVTKGNCQQRVTSWIRRTWLAIDKVGNSSFCVQNISIYHEDLSEIKMPLDYNGYITPTGIYTLACEGRFDPNFDIIKHLELAPTCVDDYLLNHEEFISSGIRVPRKLGWNTFTSGPYAGHPNTDHIYYPAHPDSNACWGSHQIIMWEGTGKPRINSCDHIGVTFSDLLINTSKNECNAGPVGCFKILRTWTLLDWCTSEVRTHQQLIKVSDEIGPEITYPDSIKIISSAHHCNGIWEVKDIWLKDQCSQELHYSIVANTGVVLGDENAGYIVTDLELGEHIVEIRAEDCCGNITIKPVIVVVTDETPPTAICQAKTVTSISSNGAAFQNYSLIKAESFDDGSRDNCSPHVYFKVIRMDELNGTLNGSHQNSTKCQGLNGDDNLTLSGSQIYFDDEVKFCCLDVGEIRMVVFRVFDKDPGSGPVDPLRMNKGGDLDGSFSDCMVEVVVQNKATPSISAPADVVVSCDYWFDIDRLSDTKDTLFGTVIDDLPWRKKVVTTDKVCAAFCENNKITHYPGSTSGINAAPYKACQYYDNLYDAAHPEKKYELLWGFDGYLQSACGARFTITVDDQRSCGQGKILRTFSTVGPNGQIISATQTIWVVDCNPFWINRHDHCDTLDDIIWPDCQSLGTKISGCGANTDPDVLGKPKIRNGAIGHCALVAIEYKDQYFSGEHDACYIIIRKWTVIDWCQYDPHLNEDWGRWEFSQVIKVNDRDKPIVNCSVGQCEPATLNQREGICYGHINLTATAVDSCTQSEWLKFEYKIDLFNNGSIDYNVGTLSKKEFDQGAKPLVKNNPNADNENNPLNASGNYPLGIHKITWYVSDGCENVGTASCLFEVKDCKAPTPYCLTGIISVPMPSTGCIDIWAKDLDFASFDNCTPKDKLKFYFDSVRTNTSIRVCCADFVKKKINDELVIPITVWVEDEEGNRDYCSTLIVIQDNQNTCPNVGNALKITGEVRTSTGNSTALVAMDLYENGQFSKTAITKSDGFYMHSGLIEFESYLLRPKRNDNHVNGVSTADIVKIQKHILGKEIMYVPYNLIAADVNNSKSITSADISEIRKLVLGVIPEFSKVQSWVIIPAFTQFEDPANPWAFKNYFDFKMKGQDELVDWMAIKMGDVTNNAVAGLNSNTKSRTKNDLNLILDNQNLVAGQKTKLEFRVKEFTQLNGFQFTLNYNPEVLLWSSYNSENIRLSDINFNLQKSKEGRITMSWDAENLISLNPNDVIFSFEFDVLMSTELKNQILISSDITTAEAYDQDMELSSILLSYKNGGAEEIAGIFELLPAQPNPFKAFTDIQFRLPVDDAVQITLYDATGKVHKIVSINGVKGLNSYRLAKSDLTGSGIYYYQVDTKRHTATGKIVLID